MTGHRARVNAQRTYRWNDLTAGQQWLARRIRDALNADGHPVTVSQLAKYWPATSAWYDDEIDTDELLTRMGLQRAGAAEPDL